MADDALLRGKLAALRNGQVPHWEVYGLIHDFGHAKFLEAEPDVVALLKHPNEQFRCIAVRVLTFHWDIRRHRDELIRLLCDDPEYEVRSFTAAGLGFVFRESRDPIVSRALIDVIRTDKDPYMRVSAYNALRNVWTLSETANQSLDKAIAEIEWGKESNRDLDSARSRREFQSKRWMWKQDLLLRIDWDFVEHIERAIHTGSSDSEHPSTGG